MRFGEIPKAASSRGSPISVALRIVSAWLSRVALEAWRMSLLTSGWKRIGIVGPRVFWDAVLGMTDEYAPCSADARKSCIYSVVILYLLYAMARTTGIPTKTIPVRLSPDLMEQVKAAARELNWKEVEIIRLCTQIGLVRLRRINYDLASVIDSAASVASEDKITALPLPQMEPTLRAAEDPPPPRIADPKRG